MKYFAYGSNMCMNRLRARVPSAQFYALGSVKGRLLKFHKQSVDGSGKCNALETDNENDELFGVVFELKEEEKAALDHAEGLGQGYHEEDIDVSTSDGATKAKMYVADKGAIDDLLEPYSWYKEFVLDGAMQHGLPESYIHNIESVSAKTDPDNLREKKNRQILLK